MVPRAACLALVALGCATTPRGPNDPESYARICETGAPDIATAACYELAVLTERGEGVPADPAAAAGLLEKACLGRGPAVPHACRALGRAYLDGRGVEADWAKAERWLLTACELGEGRSCLEAGVIADDASGIRGDAPKAVQRYEKACELDLAEGCLLHGTALATGRGVLADDAKASEVLEKACRLGAAEACDAAPSR